MGADNIQDRELEELNIEIVGKSESGSKKLKIPQESLSKYIEQVKNHLLQGYWNEIIGSGEIIFIFKFKDGVVKELNLSAENEAEIGKLCAEFNNEPPSKTANVYKYISENSFYHDFMVKYYSNLINR